MDPVRIVAGTTSLVSQTAKVVYLIKKLYDTLQDAPLLLSSITSECTVVGTSLELLQEMQGKKTNRRSLRSEQIFTTFDMALTSCSLILSKLENDVQICLQAGRNPHDRDGVRNCRLILSKEYLQELLNQLRGQQQAVTLLVTTWQSRSLEQMQQHMKDNRNMLRRIVKRTLTWCSESDQSQSTQSGDSLLRFDFDKQLLASPRYQRVKNYICQMESRQDELVSTSHFPGTGLGKSTPDNLSIFNSCNCSDSFYCQAHNDTNRTGRINTTSVNEWLETPEGRTGSLLARPFDDLSVPALADDLVENHESPARFISKRRSVPPLFSQIQANATSPDAVLGIVSPERRHRRSESKGDLVDSGSEPSNDYELSKAQISTNNLQSVIYNLGSPYDTATNEEFNTDFEEIWYARSFRRQCQSASLAAQRIVFLGDPRVCALWPTIRAKYIESAANDEVAVKCHYELKVALDNVELQLSIKDATGASPMDAVLSIESRTDLAVLCYMIDNPYSLREVTEQWALILRSICPKLPIFLLGYGRESRGDLNSLAWLRTMDQEPVTYGQGAAAFHLLQGEAFSEITTDDEDEAIDLFEAITKTCLQLQYERLPASALNGPLTDGTTPRSMLPPKTSQTPEFTIVRKIFSQPLKNIEARLPTPPLGQDLKNSSPCLSMLPIQGGTHAKFPETSPSSSGNASVMVQPLARESMMDEPTCHDLDPDGDVEETGVQEEHTASIGNPPQTLLKSQALPDEYIPDLETYLLAFQQQYPDLQIEQQFRCQGSIFPSTFDDCPICQPKSPEASRVPSVKGNEISETEATKDVARVLSWGLPRPPHLAPFNAEVEEVGILDAYFPVLLSLVERGADYGRFNVRHGTYNRPMMQSNHSAFRHQNAKLPKTDRQAKWE